MQLRKVTRIKRKSKCNAAAAEIKQGHDFLRPRSRPTIRKNFQPRTEFSSTSAFEGRLKLERSKSDFATFGWSEAGKFRYLENLDTKLELECSLSTFTIQISIFACFIHFFQLICFEVCWSKVLPL